MKILLVVATKHEIAPLLKTFGMEEQTSFFSLKSDLDLLITGPGILHTTFVLTEHLTKNTYDLILNVGVAGYFDDTLTKGEVVLVKEDIFGDFGAEDKEEVLTMFDLGLIKPDDFPFVKGKIVCDLSKYDFLYKQVSALTINMVSGNKTTINKRKIMFNAQIETMEGAAFAYVCKKKSLPYLQIRSLSNLVEVRNRANWDLPLAIENLNKEIVKLLEILK